jgi:hypothetical protein
MDIRWAHVRNPIVDREPAVSARDPAMVYHDETFRCFHTAVERSDDRFRLFVDVADSADLTEWKIVQRLTHSDLNFSSPGNVIRVAGRWILCVQSYPIAAGERYGSEDSRLWLMSSQDLTHWSVPTPLCPQGCQAGWTRSHRQIDPYLVAHADRFWCFYKTDGCLGLLESADLVTWREASPDRPVLARTDTPDGVTVENPCVLFDGNRFVLFFAPCRAGRGIGVARSDDLIHWHDVRYLDFPKLSWAPGGPTAAFVTASPAPPGRWLMAFHGDREGPHGAALGLAWSDDLEHWHCPA